MRTAGLALFFLASASGCRSKPPALPPPEPIGARCTDLEAGATTTARVTVMSINLRHDNDQWQRRFELVADEIARLDPDIIGTQELEISRDQARVLNELLAKRGHAAYAVVQRKKTGFGAGEGIGILSRWPIEQHDDAELGEERVAVYARIRHPSGGVFDVVDTHLDQHGGADGDAARDREAARVALLVAKNDDCRATVFTGDMNSTENGLALKRFAAAGFEDSFRAVHGAATPKIGNTSPVKLAVGAFEQKPRRRIDFVLARSAGPRTAKPLASIVCFQNHDADGFYPSDHFGVMTTFDLGL